MLELLQKTQNEGLDVLRGLHQNQGKRTGSGAHNLRQNMNDQKKKEIEFNEKNRIVKIICLYRNVYHYTTPQYKLLDDLIEKINNASKPHY